MQPRTHRGLLALLLVAVLLLTTSFASSQQGQIALLSFFVNEAPRGEVPILVRDDDLLVPVSGLAGLGLVAVASAGHRESIANRQYVSLASLAPAATYRFDEQDLSVRLQVNPKLLPPTTLDLHRSAPPGIEYRNDTSFHLNYAPRLVDGRAIDGYAEAGLSVRGALLWSGASLRRDGELVRGLTNVTVDDRSVLRRWVAGDSFSSGGVLGGGLYTGGISLSRNFDIDPYFVRGPSFGLATTALTPSTLDVYVNGVLVRQQQVDPGPVRVQNLPLHSGQGVATYVLRDVFGNTQTQASPFYISNGVLRKGLSEYTYTLGLARENIGQDSFTYGAPVALLRHRLGLTDSLTLGGRLEAGNGTASAGTTFTAVSRAGLVDFAAAASGARANKAGVAWATSWAYQARRVGVGAALRGMTSHYSTLSLSASDDRAILEANAFTSWSLHRTTTLGSRQALAMYRDGGLVAQLGLTGNFQLARGASLVTTATRTVLPGGRTGNELMVTLIMSFDRATTGQIGTRTRTDGHDEFIVGVNRPRPRGVGGGVRASAAYANDAVDRAQVSVEYAGRHGVYGAMYELEPAPTEPGAVRTHRVTLSTQGAIVFIPGVGLFATRPVREAIGVVRMPGVRGVRGYLNNQEVGRTNAQGNLVIPDLLPYYGNRLSIADQDLPPDHAIEQTERVIAPPFRGAALAVFDARRVVFYRGALVVVKAGREVVPAYGELRIERGAQMLESPIGKLGEMEIEGLPAGEYPAQIVYAGGQCNLRLRLPERRGPVVDIGKQPCVME